MSGERETAASRLRDIRCLSGLVGSDSVTLDRKRLADLDAVLAQHADLLAACEAVREFAAAVDPREPGMPLANRRYMIGQRQLDAIHAAIAKATGGEG